MATRSTIEVAAVNATRKVPAILVAVDGRPHGWDALEWAAAEAAATDQVLHIVHVVEWPPYIDPWTLLPNERVAGAGSAGELILEDATQRALDVAAGLRITTELVGDVPPERGILRAARTDSLIVLGRRRDRRAIRSRFGSSVSANVARHASTPVVIAGLADRSAGPSAGRVAVLIDDGTDPFDALLLAFRAADRRGIGVTVLHAGSPRTAPGQLDAATLVRANRDAFGNVDVTEDFLPAPLGPALAAATQGAALLVLGARSGRHLHVHSCPRSAGPPLRAPAHRS
jgi:nucleotide-binding universal stress UspA family protein